MQPSPEDRVATRQAVVGALEADLIGPFYPETDEASAEELLPLAPSRWYLTGFLAPESDRETRDPTADDEFAGLEDKPEETAAAEPQAKQRRRFPASMGLSVLLPADGPSEVRVTARFAEYLPEQVQEDSGGSKPRVRTLWRRRACRSAPAVVPLDPKALLKGVLIDDPAFARSVVAQWHALVSADAVVLP